MLTYGLPVVYVIIFNQVQLLDDHLVIMLLLLLLYIV